MSARVDIVQFYRLVAASIVVFGHALIRADRVFPDIKGDSIFAGLPGIQIWTQWGVDFFFVISGFVMTYTNWDRFSLPGSAAQFLKRRVARIVPIYWFLTSAGVALIATAPFLFSHGQYIDPPWIAASYLFQPWPSPSGDIFAPVLGLGWTLNYEMHFYVLFSIALLFGRQTGLIALSAFLLCCAMAGSMVKFSVPFLIQNSSWLLIEFTLGVWIAFAVKRSVPISRAALNVAALGACASMAFTIFLPPEQIRLGGLHFARFILWGIPCACILLWSLERRNEWLNLRAGRMLVAGGDASYSIYLFQVFVLPVMAICLKAAGLDRILPFDILVLIMLAGGILAGVLCYYWIERPLTRRAQSLIRNRTSDLVRQGNSAR